MMKGSPRDGEISGGRAAGDRAGRGAPSARRASWVALSIFGVTLGAIPLYRFPNVSASGPAITYRSFGFLMWFVGGFFLRDPGATALYWLIALPLGYVATAALYRYRARRRGVGGSPWAYVLVGLALFGLLFLGAEFSRLRPGDLFLRGLTPLLAIGAGLVVLAVVERSRALACFAVAFLGLAVLVNLYDIENLFSRVGVSVPVSAIGLIVPGAVLLLAAFGFWLGGRRVR
jgi:hypothetical protein